MTHELHTASPAETFRIGAALGRILTGGELIALDGPLGAGKTQFTKGLAVGAGVPPQEPIVSPTFVLVREYAGRLRLFHMDAYRLQSADDLHNLGFDELRQPGTVVVVEWAERVAVGLGGADVHVELAYAESQTAADFDDAQGRDHRTTTANSDSPAAQGEKPTNPDDVRVLRVTFADGDLEHAFRRALAG